MTKNIVNLIFSGIVLLLIFNLPLYSQPRTQKGIKVGLEFSSYLTEDGGKFTKKPGNLVGLYTNPSLCLLDDETALRLKVELNYVRLYHYIKGASINDMFGLDDPKESAPALDVEYSYHFVELGAIPEYYHQIDKDNAYGIFMGPSVGIGTQQSERKFYSGGRSSDNGDPSFPLTINLGITYYYKFLSLDVRYRYTDFTGDYYQMRNITAQVGIMF